MAEATIKGYKMGEDNITDFLAINIASTDYVGHAFWPKFYRNRRYLFKIRQRFRSVFQQLDKKSRKRKLLVFLSADHGAAHAEGYM